MNKKIIGLCGKKKSGKDTLGLMLVKEFNKSNFENSTNEMLIFHFADNVKYFCHDYLGLDLQKMFGTDEEKNELTHLYWRQMPFLPNNFQPPEGVLRMTYRQVMQYVGTEWFRKIDPNIWVKKCFEDIKKSHCSIAVICDVRFPNEVFAIKDTGGLCVKIIRENNSLDSHSSEVALDKHNFDSSNFNYLLDNNCDINTSFNNLKHFVLNSKFLPNNSCNL